MDELIVVEAGPLDEGIEPRTSSPPQPYDLNTWKCILGAKILDRISESEPYRNIYSNPLAMLEMMLLNRELDQLSTVLENIKPTLLEDFDNCSQEYKGHHDIEGLLTFVEDHQDMSVSTACVNKLLLIYADHSLAVNSISKNEDNVQSANITTPDWVPDDEVLFCMCCELTRFTQIQRKHHCRMCGRVVCNNCSKWKKKILNSFKNRPVRHCDDCLGIGRPSMTRTTSISEEDPEVTTFWTLSGDSSVDTNLRKDFWNQSSDPDVKLCLSLLDLVTGERDCHNFMRHHCNRLEGLIRNTGQAGGSASCKTLASALHWLVLAAKVRCPFVTDWDMIIAKVQIMKELVHLNLEKLIPAEQLSTMDILKKLRDNLLNAKMYKLAFDTSIICGLTTSPVLFPWGIDCLKTGHYFLAREKLSQLQLPRIVSCRDAEMMCEEISVNRQYPIQFSRGSALLRPKETAHTVLEILKVLEEKYDVDWEQESYYYLFLYGSHKDIIRFMCRNLAWMAFRYILDQSVDFDDFLEAVILTPNEITEFDLVVLMRGSDPGLEKWDPYLNKLCSIYEKKNVLATIYNLQAALGDDIRAGLTCIKFFSNNCSHYRCFLDQLHYLDNAEFHFKRDLKKKHHLQLNTSLPKRSSKLVLDANRINLHLKTIALQKKISRFLASFEQGKNLLEIVETFSGIERPLSIFDHQHMRSLIVLLVSCDIARGYELFYDILSCYSSLHRLTEVHQLVIDYFTDTSRVDKAIEFISYARTKGDSVELDKCILATVTKAAGRNDMDRGMLQLLINSIESSQDR